MRVTIPSDVLAAANSAMKKANLHHAQSQAVLINPTGDGNQRKPLIRDRNSIIRNQGNINDANNAQGPKYEIGDSESGDHFSGDSNISLSSNNSHNVTQLAIRNFFMVILYKTNNTTTDELIEVENTNL